MKYLLPIGLLIVCLANVGYMVATQAFLLAESVDSATFSMVFLSLNSLLLLVVAVLLIKRPQNATDDDDALVYASKEADEPRHYEDPGQDVYRVIEHIPDFLCLKDADGRWLRASRPYLFSFNLQDVNYIGRTDDDLLHLQDCNARAMRLSTIQDKSAWHLRRQAKETRVITRQDNKSQILEITRTPVFTPAQARLCLIITGHFIDQTEKNKFEQVEQAFKISHLCFLFLDAQFKISRVNLAFCQLTGYTEEELEFEPLSAIIDEPVELIRAKFFDNEQTVLWSGELRCRHKNGRIFPVKLDIAAIAKNDQETTYFGTMMDITAQKQTEQHAMKMAHYDDLTGLVNRVVFFERLNKFLAESKRHHLYAVIFFVDLDRFKTVNDSLGHDAGNALLKEAASRLLSIMSEDDVVARLSGDEFALLKLNLPTHEQAIYAASMVAGEVVQKLSDAYHVRSREVFIGASIGISIYPEDGLTGDVLLKNADMAMYEAKKQGRNNYQFYKKDYATANQDRLLMEINLRKALEKNELQLYYQPQYFSVSRKIVGAEVLIRWFHGSTGQNRMIPPDKFIHVAEETGLIVEIGEWIMRTACLQMKKWQMAKYPLQQVSVNVSARQFTDNNFLKSVEDALSEADLSPKFLELEITESMLVGDIKQIELQLNRLKKMGIKIALDDFGTGYSSLSYLKSFPIDVLKIDQSFIREMTVDSKDARLASAIIEMGHSLGQKIIAEGVETEAQLEYLALRGCDIIQGYFFSKPLPTQDMTILLAKEAQKNLTSPSGQQSPLSSKNLEKNIFDKDLL